MPDIVLNDFTYLDKYKEFISRKELEKKLPTFTPRLSEILYRIDVPEAQVASLKNVPDDIYYRCMAEMIMRRIILKVAIRKMYSDKKQ